MRKWLLRGMLDGVLHGLLMVGLSELLSSTWVVPWLTEERMGGLIFAVPLGMALISALVFALCIHGQRHMVRWCLWSSLFCLLTWGLALVNAMEWHVRLLPVREGSNGDGLLLVLALMVYLGSALALRGLVLIYEGVWRTADEKA